MNTSTASRSGENYFDFGFNFGPIRRVTGTLLPRANPPQNVLATNDETGGILVTWDSPVGGATDGYHIKIYINGVLSDDQVIGNVNEYSYDGGPGSYVGNIRTIGDPGVTRDSLPIPFSAIVSSFFFLTNTPGDQLTNTDLDELTTGPS